MIDIFSGVTGLLHKLWSKESPDPVFVHHQTLQNNAKKAIDELNQKDGIEIKKNRFVTKSEIRNIFRTEEEMGLIIDYLKSIEKCDTCSVNDVIYIKFNLQKGHAKVEEDDCSLLKLHILSKSTLNEINALEKLILVSKQSIREKLKSGSRTQAKYELKRLKRMEATVEKKLTILNNLEIIVESIETASSQIDVMNAYKAGVKALKSEIRKNETVENAAEIMDDVNDYIDKVKEISDILSAENMAYDTSEDELNEELEKLLNEEATQEELIKTLNNLDLVEHNPDEARLPTKQKNLEKLSSLEYST